MNKEHYKQVIEDEAKKHNLGAFEDICRHFAEACFMEYQIRKLTKELKQ